MEYTKGEWEIAHYESGILEGVNFIRSANNKEISICTISSTNESSEANTQLIAAAPMMYEAIQELIAQMPGLWGDRIFNGMIRLDVSASTIDKLMDAMSKAEGK